MKYYTNNDVFDRMLISLEHKYGKESHEVITFKSMIYGRVTREKIMDYWKKKIKEK